MQQFIRYRQLLSSLAGPVLETSSSGEAAPDSVTFSCPAARLILSDEPRLYARLAEGLKHLAHLAAQFRGPDPLADGAGHHRTVYWPFVVDLHLEAFGWRYEALPGDIWGMCEDAITPGIEPMRRCENYCQQPPPHDCIDVVLWQVLCILRQSVLLGRDADSEWASTVVHQIVSRPGKDGALHQRSGDESLDTWTYRELCGLHALSELALLTRNKAWSQCVSRIARYHMDHTQPDHITNQPWALFAFAWCDDTRLFAEQQMHDAATHRIEPLAAMLLADAAGAMARFQTPNLS